MNLLNILTSFVKRANFDNLLHFFMIWKRKKDQVSIVEKYFKKTMKNFGFDDEFIKSVNLSKV